MVWGRCFSCSKVFFSSSRSFSVVNCLSSHFFLGNSYIPGGTGLQLSTKCFKTYQVYSVSAICTEDWNPSFLTNIWYIRFTWVTTADPNFCPNTASLACRTRRRAAWAMPDVPNWCIGCRSLRGGWPAHHGRGHEMIPTWDQNSCQSMSKENGWFELKELWIYKLCWCHRMTPAFHGQFAMNDLVSHLPRCAKGLVDLAHGNPSKMSEHFQTFSWAYFLLHHPGQPKPKICTIFISAGKGQTDLYVTKIQFWESPRAPILRIVYHLDDLQEFTKCFGYLGCWNLIFNKMDWNPTKTRHVSSWCSSGTLWS